MARYLTDLDAACRLSGLPVITEPGWKTRGQGGLLGLRGIVCHWTATPDTIRPGEDYPSLAVVRDGHSKLRGLLSQLGLGRRGTARVIGAGMAYHAGEGYWPRVGANGNGYTIGIEAEEGGDGDWTDEQLDAYPRLVAGLCRHYGLPVSRVISHHEWAGPRKSDIRLWPGGMPAFRSTVHKLLTAPPAVLDVPEEDDMRLIKGDKHPAIFVVYWSAPGAIAVRKRIPNPRDPGYLAALACGHEVVTVPQHVIDAIPNA